LAGAPIQARDDRDLRAPIAPCSSRGFGDEGPGDRPRDWRRDRRGDLRSCGRRAFGARQDTTRRKRRAIAGCGWPTGSRGEPQPSAAQRRPAPRAAMKRATRAPRHAVDDAEQSGDRTHNCASAASWASRAPPPPARGEDRHGEDPAEGDDSPHDVSSEAANDLLGVAPRSRFCASVWAFADGSNGSEAFWRVRRLIGAVAFTRSRHRPAVGARPLHAKP